MLKEQQKLEAESEEVSEKIEEERKKISNLQEE